MITRENLDHWFMYHPPDPEDIEKYKKLREAAKQFAQAVIDNAPDSADRTEAIRKIREAVMTANAAIACKGK